MMNLYLSNVELMLLQLIGEAKEISGYDIDRLVVERGYRNWADIGMTSIYVGLEKLRKKNLTDSFLNTEKTGKGPVPRLFKLNKSGWKTLKWNIKDALANYRERDRRFDLGIAGIPFISEEDVILSLKQRKKLLIQASTDIRDKFKKDGGENLPYYVKILFRHPLSLIEKELEFMDLMIEEVKKRQDLS